MTPVLDRKYFKSIYFREPNGILLELATILPGFGVDEPMEALGTSLTLPDWLEPRRRAIEASLEPISLPVEKSLLEPSLGASCGNDIVVQYHFTISCSLKEKNRFVCVGGRLPVVLGLVIGPRPGLRLVRALL